MNQLWNDMWDGKIGKVLDNCLLKSTDNFYWNDDRCEVMYEGKLYSAGKELCSVDDFEFKDEELVLIKEDGYRGLGCYSGYVVREGVLYYFDVLNDFVVYEMEECRSFETDMEEIIKGG